MSFALLSRNGVAAVRNLVSTRGGFFQCRRRRLPPHAAAAAFATSTTTDDNEEEEQSNQDTLRATLRDLPGPLASTLADELLLCGALSASVDEYRPPGAAEQALFGARGRDNNTEANDADGDDDDDDKNNPFSPSGDGAPALFWDRSTLTVILDPSADFDAILAEASLNAGIDGASLPEPEMTVAKASEWLSALRGAFAPVFIDGGDVDGGGGRWKSLWILPEGCSLPERAGNDEEEAAAAVAAAAAVVVRLTPGLAFGSGDHPTTRLCLRWLASLPLDSPPPPTTLLDYGTGSGVLAAAAVALGCRSAVGTDVDPLALVAASENVALNCPAAAPSPSPPRPPPPPVFRTVLVSADLDSPTEKEKEEEEESVGPPESFDAVVANILRGPLVALAPRLSRLAKPGAAVAVSGILASQAEQVRGAFEAAGVELEEFGRERAAAAAGGGGGGGGGGWEEGDEWWVCLSGRKKT